MNEALRKLMKPMQYRLDILLTCVRRYVAHRLSLTPNEGMTHERGVTGQQPFAWIRITRQYLVKGSPGLYKPRR